MTHAPHSSGRRAGTESITLYHNPDCSKSRAVLALLEQNDITPDIVYYLDQPPATGQLKELLAKLHLEVRDILRRSEPEFEDLGLEDTSLSDDILLDILSRHPQLLQRPILVKGDSAIIGRPPEKVLQWLDL
ncbi:MAG: Arsenate reductase [Pseudomonadota bacterium]|jgi:arsenate reductase